MKTGSMMHKLTSNVPSCTRLIIHYTRVMQPAEEQAMIWYEQRRLKEARSEI